MRRCAFVEQRKDRGGEGRPERIRLSRGNVSSVESSQRFSGEVVVAACLHRYRPLAQAGERECVVAYGPNVVLGLPVTSPFDAGARMKCIDDAPPEEIVRD